MPADGSWEEGETVRTIEGGVPKLYYVTTSGSFDSLSGVTATKTDTASRRKYSIDSGFEQLYVGQRIDIAGLSGGPFRIDLKREESGVDWGSKGAARIR